MTGSKYEAISGTRFEGKVALVTAGASGIGRATVEGFARESAKVVFADIGDAGAEVENSCRAAGLDVTFIKCDVTDEASVAGLVAEVVGRHGQLDAAANIVGNMGGGDRAGLKLDETPLEAWEGTMRVNLLSSFLCMKYQIQQMMRQESGAIVNTSSLAGIRTTPNGSAAYATAKAGIVHLSRLAAVQYAAANIRINIVAPGLTETPNIVSHWTPEQRKIMAQSQPMNRMMTPREVAEAFLWLCSDQSSGVTGLTLPVDGGWAAR